MSWPPRILSTDDGADVPVADFRPPAPAASDADYLAMNPTSVTKAAPTLIPWQVRADCLAAE
jgi:hypothetical protein